MKKIYFIKKFFLGQQSQNFQSNLVFFVIVPVDVVFFRNSPIYMALAITAGTLLFCYYFSNRALFDKYSKRFGSLEWEGAKTSSIKSVSLPKNLPIHQYLMILAKNPLPSYLPLSLLKQSSCQGYLNKKGDKIRV